MTGSVDEIIAKSGRSIEQIMGEVKVALGDAWTSDGGETTRELLSPLENENVDALKQQQNRMGTFSRGG